MKSITGATNIEALFDLTEETTKSIRGVSLATFFITELPRDNGLVPVDGFSYLSTRYLNPEERQYAIVNYATLLGRSSVTGMFGTSFNSLMADASDRLEKTGKTFTTFDQVDELSALIDIWHEEGEEEVRETSTTDLTSKISVTDNTFGKTVETEKVNDTKGLQNTTQVD